MKTDTTFCTHDHDTICKNCANVTVVEKNEVAEAIREIYQKEKKSQAQAAWITLLIVVALFGYCTYSFEQTGKRIEKEKQWCREASATQFVDQFETRCAQYRYEPEIKARIERILAGVEK